MTYKVVNISFMLYFKVIITAVVFVYTHLAVGVVFHHVGDKHQFTINTIQTMKVVSVCTLFLL